MSKKGRKNRQKNISVGYPDSEYLKTVRKLLKDEGIE